MWNFHYIPLLFQPFKITSELFIFQSVTWLIFFFYWAWMIVTIWNQWSMTDPAFSLYYDFFLHISYASLLEWESSFRTNFNPHFGIFFYFSFCLLLYCMVLYLDALVGGCYCQKWPSKNVNSYNWLLLVIKSPYLLV